eukprot:143802-Heterocapsa_arctica.AAC.1
MRFGKPDQGGVARGPPRRWLIRRGHPLLLLVDEVAEDELDSSSVSPEGLDDLEHLDVVAHVSDAYILH